MATVGVDEVGRGCWAGPLVAGAVILGVPIDGLKDSKKLSKKRRQFLAEQIKLYADAFGVGWVSPKEIDKMGLTQAVRLAMLRAVKQLHEADMKYDEIIIDGNINFFEGVRGLATSRVIAMTRADDSVPAVSAASILAKVERDAYMARIAAKYPDYGFEKHVGYGTVLHRCMLSQKGVTDQHRRSFAPIKKYT